MRVRVEFESSAKLLGAQTTYCAGCRASGESEVKRLEADASRVEGEETPEGNGSNYTQGEKIRPEAENVQSPGENHESAAATFKSEAESKENEAAQERSKGIGAGQHCTHVRRSDYWDGSRARSSPFRSAQADRQERFDSRG